MIKMESKKDKNIAETVNDAFRKIKDLEHSNKLDLSSKEDLSIALMNLISIEEHLYFSGAKTGKDEYFALLDSVREIRKNLMAGLVKKGEGEEWCVSKHLLAATMRLIEVGMKEFKADRKSAETKFTIAFKLYSLFWEINLLSSSSGKYLKHMPEKFKIRNGWAAFIKKALDCCKE